MTATGVAGRAERLTALLDRIDGALVAPARPELAPLVHWRGGAHLPIHRWYRYREGFSPELIPALGLGYRILDPFCGSGTSAVSAHLAGRRCATIEIDPLYVDAALKRLSTAVGEPAIHADGRSYDEIAAERAGEEQVDG